MYVWGEKNPYFGKHLFAKQKLITRARLRVQDFTTGKNFSFNHCHNKELCVFSQESYFIKAMENFFQGCTCSYKTRQWLLTHEEEGVWIFGFSGLAIF